MSERGVFAIDRGVFDHECFAPEPFTEREAWMWLISEAAWKARNRRVGNFIVELKRGQLAASLRFMADKWGWHYSSVVRYLEKLRLHTMIATDGKDGITVITICKYDRYQRVSLPDAEASETGEATDPKQTRNKTEDIKHIELDDDGGSARPNAFEVASQLAEICGHPTPDVWPPGWCGSPHWVQKCLNEGWLPEIMISETRAVVGRKRDGPIDHFKYLEKPLARAHAMHQAPLPKVQVPQQEVIHGANPSAQVRGGSALDAIRQVRRGMGSEPDRNTPLGLPKR